MSANSPGSASPTFIPVAAPTPATDPIAIAALIAELPELEAKYNEAKASAEVANKALDAILDRIERAIAMLKRKAPIGSKWGTPLNQRQQDVYPQLSQMYEANRMQKGQLG